MDCLDLGFGLLGEHLSHSYSPLIHKELGNYKYKLYEKRPEELADFFQNSDFNGINVTIPYKKTVIKFCKELSETVHLTGSVNIITRCSDGSFYGDNTDYFGFAYLLKKIKVNITSGKIIILGSGGSSLTTQAVLRDMNSGEIIVVSRTGIDNNYKNIEKHKDAILIINTTPVGMYSNDNYGVSPLADIKIFKNCQAVVDLIYNPPKTELMIQAEKLGISCVNGLVMLVAQAKKSAELFMHTSIPDEQIEVITSKFAV